MKSIVITTVLAATCWLQTSEAQAGPLLDWLRGIRRTSGTQNGLFNQPTAKALLVKVLLAKAQRRLTIRLAYSPDSA